MIPAMGIGPLGAGEWSVPSIGTLSGPSSASGAIGGTAAASGSDSFGNALTNAIGSLENTQATATTASQQLATGQLTDPTQAVTAVENAALSMDYASQIRNGLDSVATTLFSTQL